MDPPDGSEFFQLGAQPQRGTPSSNGISAVNAPLNSLVGVFLGDSVPSSSGPPPRLDFEPATGLGLAFASLSPVLKQVFFIGDGLTGNGTGAAQQFIVPAGATRLFLGPVDGTGWVNNSGAFTVQVTASAGTFRPAWRPPSCPSSRSVQVGTAATAFATIINAGPIPALSCGISPATPLPATFVYQTTNSGNQYAHRNAGVPA